MTFKPGQSGNPAGRPPIPEEVKKLARSYSIDAIEGLVSIAKADDLAASARVAAWNAVLDRGIGKPPQLSTSDTATFKRAIDYTDDELASILAGSGDTGTPEDQG